MNGVDVVRYDLSDKSVTSVLNSKYREINPSVSNNGRYILYSSNESGRGEIYVSELGGDGGRWQISNEGGYSPKWSHDNSEIFYWHIDDLMTVDVDMAGGKFKVSQPKKLFTRELNYAGDFSIFRYDVAKDGQKFLLNVHLQTQTQFDNIIVVQNWLEELEN